LLPFALLVRKTDPVEGQGERDFEYLVEWKPLHSVLSATVYDELRNQRQTQPVERTADLALVAFGDPKYPSKKAGADLATDRSIDVHVRAAAGRGFDFHPLPYSREEVGRIAALYPNGTARTFLGVEASEERAKSIGKSARILHFATHGRYDNRFPLNSYLALTIPREFRRDQDNGLLQAWEIFESVRLDADLVVLSACESGLGDEIDGEGLKGLTRAFQFAGARTVVASLWQVDDQATAELMQRFYLYLKMGASKDEALRAAQLELIQNSIEMKNRQGQVVRRDLSSPYYWAAFQMIGDWK
jgi:CHAT domain-containing protein